MNIRLICALAVVACGVATFVARGALGGERLISSAADFALLIAASAIVGAVFWPRMVWPRARGWLRPILGGILSGPLVILVALIPEAAMEAYSGRMPVDQIVLWLIFGALIALALSAPIYVAGAVLLNAMLRRR